ncbi:MAG: UbiA prenyltransferase family protein [Phycisphaeraceae bacterium]|nr:UbiA prenyltransferase family protein [Phycisphaeraceae bacterium]MBX3406553.1 UbiA prenyltransferase family protein [Phycisphaeraceae bacterium]
MAAETEQVHSPALAAPRPKGLARDLLRLARPKQWVKSGFVLIGPMYGLADLARENTSVADWTVVALGAVGAVLAFGFAASAGYVVNDLRDREQDLAHPRKSRRPIAAGRVSISAARVYAGVLAALSLGAVLMVGAGPWGESGDDLSTLPRTLLGLCVLLYAANTLLYSLVFKRAAVLDVVSLAMGFVLRVLGGCAALGIAPSAWLLSCTFFVSMFLALGKRLGERRTLGADAAAARGVQALYTDDFLRMSVVVTGVATLLSYSDYVVAQSETYTYGFNLLWLTILPATYGLLRCIVLIERGVYDDPTELATRDRPFQAACAVFGLLTIALLVGVKLGWLAGA